jgi:hypothetical protein
MDWAELAGRRSIPFLDFISLLLTLLYIRVFSNSVVPKLDFNMCFIVNWFSQGEIMIFNLFTRRYDRFLYAC